MQDQSQHQDQDRVYVAPAAPDCSICLCEISPLELYTTNCNHTFHHGCISRAWMRNNNCPYCRTPMFTRARPSTYATPYDRLDNLEQRINNLNTQITSMLNNYNRMYNEVLTETGRVTIDNVYEILSAINYNSESPTGIASFPSSPPAETTSPPPELETIDWYNTPVTSPPIHIRSPPELERIDWVASGGDVTSELAPSL